MAQTPSAMSVAAGQPSPLPGGGHRPRSSSWDAGNPRTSGRHHHHEIRPLVVLSSSTMHLVGVPLIIIASLATGFILYWLKEILVPFVVAMFFVYLLRPIVNFLSRPYASCCHRRLIDNRYIRLASVEPLGHPTPRRRRRAKLSDEDGNSKGRAKSNSSLFGKRRFAPGGPDNLTPMSTTASRTPRVSQNSAMLYGWTEDSGYAPPVLSCCGFCTVTRCPRWIAVVVALLIAFGILTGICLLVADAVQSFESNDLKMYQNSAQHVSKQTLNWINKVFHVDGSSLLNSFKGDLNIADVVQKLFLVLIDAVGNTFLIMLVVLYLLFEQTSHPTGSLRRKIDTQIQRYIGIKTLISGVVGFAAYLVLGPLLGIKLAHLFGILTFLLNYIPNVGPVIATALPLPIIILDPTLSTTPKLLAIALPTAIHMVVGNFLEPKVFGRSLELHPVVVLMALAFWFALWGVVGAILSIPVTAVLRIVLSHIDHSYARVLINLLEGQIGLGQVTLPVQKIGLADLDAMLGSDGGSVSDRSEDMEEGLLDEHKESSPTPATDYLLSTGSSSDRESSRERTSTSGLKNVSPRGSLV